MRSIPKYIGVYIYMSTEMYIMLLGSILFNYCHDWTFHPCRSLPSACCILRRRDFMSQVGVRHMGHEPCFSITSQHHTEPMSIRISENSDRSYGSIRLSVVANRSDFMGVTTQSISWENRVVTCTWRTSIFMPHACGSPSEILEDQSPGRAGG